MLPPASVATSIFSPEFSVSEFVRAGIGVVDRARDADRARGVHLDAARAAARGLASVDIDIEDMDVGRGAAAGSGNRVDDDARALDVAVLVEDILTGGR